MFRRLLQAGGLWSLPQGQEPSQIPCAPVSKPDLPLLARSLNAIGIPLRIAQVG